VPEADVPPIVYPAAVIKTTTHPDEARAFLSFLRTREASAIFSAAGFGPPPSAAPASTATP
jgi:molybdate transport system substrate-binding protein